MKGANIFYKLGSLALIRVLYTALIYVISCVLWQDTTTVYELRLEFLLNIKTSLARLLCTKSVHYSTGDKWCWINVNRVDSRVCTEISESPKFHETFRSVSVKRFAKFRTILKVSGADIFPKFQSISAISVISQISATEISVVLVVFLEYGAIFSQ